jgi:hypothetical protein
MRGRNLLVVISGGRFRGRISTHPSPSGRLRRAIWYAKNKMHNALNFTKPLRIQAVGRLDVFIVRPAISKARRAGANSMSCRRKSTAGIVILGLDVADAAVVVLKLALNEKIRLACTLPARRWFTQPDPQADGGSHVSRRFEFGQRALSFLGPFGA